MSPAEIQFWQDRTKAADVRGYFTRSDSHDANDWPSCAVGEKVKLFPMVVLATDYGEPRDKVLDRLGCEFGDVVRDSYQQHDPEYAAWHTPMSEHPILDAYELLDLITARVMVLKARAA